MKKIRIVMRIFKNPHVTKLIRTMKLTCLLLTFALIQVSAETYSQTKKLTLNFKDAPLAILFQEIEKSSEFHFFYDSSGLDLTRKVTISVEESGIEDVLETLFGNLDISYEIFDRYIIIHYQPTKTKNLSILFLHYSYPIIYNIVFSFSKTYLPSKQGHLYGCRAFVAACPALGVCPSALSYYPHQV
jgi:hypothetical protein